MKTSYIYCATKLKFIPSTKEHGHQDGTFLLPMLALQRKCHVAFWALVLKFIVMCNMRVAKSMARFDFEHCAKLASTLMDGDRCFTRVHVVSVLMAQFSPPSPQ